jgi:DNA binding domain, excisionase family
MNSVAPRRRTTKLTVTEMAEMKGVNTSAIRHAIRRGQLPACKVGKTWLISRADAEAWQQKNTWTGKAREKDTDGTLL